MIDAALRAVAAYVDDNASSTAWDPHQRLPDEQRFAKGEKIKVVAEELRTLAGASETRKLRYDEYDGIKSAIRLRVHPHAETCSGCGDGVPRC